MIKQILKSPQAVIGLLLMIAVLTAAFLCPILAPHDPDQTNLLMKYAAPCAEYPLGADELGRCELSRLLYGTRYSMGISLPFLLILAFLGLFLGTLSACGGEVVDHILTFVCDVFISFPQLVIAIAIIGILGVGIRSIIIAIVIAMWAWFARMVRSYAVLEMGKDYILSARLAGCGTLKLIFQHLIPNILPQFLVYLSTGVASSIVMVSGFAFLGLGLPSGTAEWGAMLNSARSAMFSHPEMLIYPGLCILIAAAGFNLFGEALRDLLEDSHG
ncbi:MAG: ABC transporter permease subunit [Oscillospiraceae bacterium]|nr:ABC transporter permease subunit [Oscillospiraceae bacterium]